MLKDIKGIAYVSAGLSPKSMGMHNAIRVRKQHLRLQFEKKTKPNDNLYIIVKNYINTPTDYLSFCVDFGANVNVYGLNKCIVETIFRLSNI